MDQLPDVEKIREQFAEIADISDPLTREYRFSLLENEAQKIGISPENYRRLFETYLQNKIYIPQYPQKWLLVTEWINWFIKFPKKQNLGRDILLRFLQKGLLISLTLSLITYCLEAPKRKQQAHYQGWEIINGAKDQLGSGGRIEALEDLNQDRVSLRYIILDHADLSGINLNNAFLIGASFKKSQLTCATQDNGKRECTKMRNANFLHANLQEAVLYHADFQKSNFENANFQDAKLQFANFENTKLYGAKFQGANLENTNIKNASLCLFEYKLEHPCANFIGTEGLNSDQIKSAKDWQNACYDRELRIKLNLLPDNPDYCQDNLK